MPHAVSLVTGTAYAAGVVSQRPLGNITRGTTNPNRLRRCDRWLLATHRDRLTKGDPPHLVDLGHGASGVTTVEWADRVQAVRPGATVTGLEIDPERVASAQAWARPGVDFRLGGFEVPGRPARIVRAFNVLRQYDETEVEGPWRTMLARLDPRGLLVEGTCDELGRLGSWVTLDADGPQTLTLSWRLRDLGPDVATALASTRSSEAATATIEAAVNWSLPANTAITYAKIATRIAMNTTATIALRTRARGPGAS